MKFLNKSDIPLVLWWSVIAIVVVLALIACNAEAEYINEDGSVIFGQSTFEATDGIKYLTSDYPGSDFVNHGTYWSTPTPSPLSGRFYQDGRIYLGKDTDHYIGMKPVGIFYVNYQDPTERQQLISLTSMSLSVNDNIATYSQGLVNVVFTNSFSKIKGDVIFPNSPPVPTVSNPALAMVWEIVGHAGINTEDGEKSTWWFEEAKAAFPIGDIQNNGSAVLKKKIFRQNGKIYLVEGVGYNWISDVNRTDSHFILDPSVEYNGSDNWAGLSGTMLEHGDGNLRAPPSVWEGIAGFWSPGTDVGSGTILKDLSGNGNDGTIHGATWNMTSGMLEYDGINDYVDCGDSTDFENLDNITLMTDFIIDTYQNAGIIGENYFGEYIYGIRSELSGLLVGKFYNNTGSSAYLSSGVTATLDTPYNVGLTYENGATNTVKIFVDGNYKNQNTFLGSLKDDTENFYIGSTRYDQKHFNGSIGSSYFFNVVLTNNQINETCNNYHNITSYMETDSPIDAGDSYVNKYVWFNGTDAGSNTTIELQVKQNATATWETAIADVTMNTNLTIPVAYLYQNASFRWFANTSYQPEADVIESVTFITGTPPPKITLVSFYPTPLNTNYTGATTISYMVESTNPLNLSSLAFLYGLNYTIPAGGDMHNYIGAPPNDIAFEGIYRAPNRNVTPYLSWEFNNTITEGNVWQWGGGDNNSWWISKTPINATHTWVNVTGVTQHILPSSFYLQKVAMYNAPKTSFEINRQQGLIFKMWNVEELRNRDTNYLANLYFDTSWESTLPTESVEVGFCNGSYDPAVDDIDTCLNCTKFDEWNGTRWVNHSWDPGANASYAYPLVVNASQFTDPSPDEINYIWLRSETLSSKSYILNATDYDPGICNVSYNETNTMWTYNEINGVTSPAAYTPSFFTTFARDDEELLHHLYIADDTGEWGHSEIFNESIGISSVPVSTISFEHFCLTLDAVCVSDTDMDSTYDNGTLTFNIHAPADPDGGSVDHNITLHYANNQTLAGIINNTLTTTGDEYVNISFDTTSYYSSSDYYTMKCVSVDDEGSTATKWLESNFTLDADGNQGWISNGAVNFWGFNDIPTLYTTISNNSLISYDAGDDIYTMHIPFFKSKYNDTFNFNETVYLKSLNDEYVAYFRFIGETVFDNANIHAWNTTSSTFAPITDTYRGYVYSTIITCGNIDNSNFSYLGSDLYRQEGLNFIGTTNAYTINNTVFSHNAEGLIMEECANFTISNCTISDNVNVGVGVYFSSDSIVENNTITSNGGNNINIYEGNDNIIRYNNIINAGAHGIRLWSNSGNNTCIGNDITGSAVYDYYLSSSSTGNYIIDPASTTDKIRVTSTSSVNIENTDNAAFSEDSLNTSYAYLTNFSMYVSGVSQTFDITQHNVIVTPSTDKLSIWNLEWSGNLSFNTSSDTALNPTWYNATNSSWSNYNVLIYRNGTYFANETTDVTGLFTYNYSDNYTNNWFEFVLGDSLNLDNFTFTNAAITPSAIRENEPFTVSVDINDTDGSIADAIVKINSNNYSMVNTAGDTWAYTFTGTSVPTRYEIDNFYAQDDFGAWNSTISPLYIDALPSTGTGSSGGIRPRIIPVIIPELIVNVTEEVIIKPLANISEVIERLVSEDIIKIFKFNYKLNTQIYNDTFYVENVQRCEFTSDVIAMCDVEAEHVTVTFVYEPDGMIYTHSDSITLYADGYSEYREVDIYVVNFANPVWWIMLIVIVGAVVLYRRNKK